LQHFLASGHYLLYISFSSPPACFLRKWFCSPLLLFLTIVINFVMSSKWNLKERQLETFPNQMLIIVKIRNFIPKLPVFPALGRHLSIYKLSYKSSTGSQRRKRHAFSCTYWFCSTTIPCSVEHWASIDSISADFFGEKYMFIDLDLYSYTLCTVFIEGDVFIKLAIHLELCYVGVVHIKIAWKHSESCNCIEHTQRFLYFPVRTI
jgi:hypothetical protein